MDPARQVPRQKRSSRNSAVPTEKRPVSSHHQKEYGSVLQREERPAQSSKLTSLSPTPEQYPLEQQLRSSSSNEWDEVKARRNLERDLSSEQLQQVKTLLVAARRQVVNEERIASGDIMSSRRTGQNMPRNLSISPDATNARSAQRELSLSPTQQQSNSRSYNRDLSFEHASLVR